MSPDERAFRVDLHAEPFSAGITAGWWRLAEEIDWPGAVVAITATPRTGAPNEYFFRFDLTGYPNPGPTAQVWNPDQKRLATEAERPKVSYAPSPFRTNWNEGTALYIPCDREALSGHPDWLRDHPENLWNPEVGISLYLRYVHGRLNEKAYVGI